MIKHDGHVKCRKHEPRASVGFFFFFRFSAFLECSQMVGAFYHCAIHGLGFFICFMIQIYARRTIKQAFSDITLVFDQSVNQSSLFLSLCLVFFYIC